MKGKNYILTYICGLVIGILLLIFHDREALYNTVVMIIGALIVAPSLILLITELARKKEFAGNAGYAMTLKLTSIIASVAGIAFGIWMLVHPAFFVKAIIYTLGVILMLGGILQIIAIYIAAKPLRPAIGWFIIPLLTLIVGGIIIILGPAKVSSAAGLITGITLVIYAANGLASAGREAKESEDTMRLEHTIALKDKDSEEDNDIK